MKTFKQFVRERTQFPYLFHGTSSVYKADIKRSGLKPGIGKNKMADHEGVYVTVEFDAAVAEAESTVNGQFGEGAGGQPIIVVIQRDHPGVVKLQRDLEYAGGLPGRYSHAFFTIQDIPPSAIVDFIRPTNTKYQKLNKPMIRRQYGALANLWD